ncbi:MAG: S9 family peptidase [Duncaniella sp.]|nr:S9 family peptidase [Duncaniella sp.]
MKSLVSSLIIATSLSLSFAYDGQAAPPRQSVSVMADLSPFVYPHNRVRSFDRPVFTTDGKGYLSLSDDAKTITSIDLATGKEIEVVMDVTRTRENNIPAIESFILSPDGSKLLVATRTRPIYRRSTTARYYIYDIRTRMLTPLSSEHYPQRSPLFSPDSRIIAFVDPADNNIYLKKLDYGSEVAVTTDGKPDNIINGVPDWVYEEEFTTTCSMAWSADSRTLCFLKYNERKVHPYSFPLYQGTCDPMEKYALYPGSFTCKYPVAGTPNSKVSLHSYDVDLRKIKDLSVGNADTEYIPRIGFGGADPSRLMVVTLNRAQNRMEVFAVNPGSGVSRSVLVEQSEAWLPDASYEQIAFESDRFVVLSARTGRQHAYAYSYAGSLDRALTSGDFDVTEWYGADAAGNIFYQSDAPGAIHRVVSRKDAKGNVTDLSVSNGTASAWFSPDKTFCGLTYSNSTTPPSTNLCNSRTGKSVRTLVDNSDVASRFASAPKPEFISIPGADGLAYNAYIYRPAGFSPSKKYPVIMYQYSGPGSQQVLDRWVIDWMPFAAQQGFVVVCADGRGTFGRGRAWETVVYRDLGHYETIDQQSAARWVASQSWADPDRIGITGWSYGGYETLMAISSGADPLYAAAVAIAPVTSWRYYDTVYAERFMLTPQENEDGYNRSAPLSYVDRMNIPLLIIHGTADDNVHLSNTMEYVSALESSGRFCDMLLYPNMNHSINGCDARLNVYSKMLDYFNRNLR